MTTALTRLSAVRMQLAEVLATECASCGHALKLHPTSQRSDKNPCVEWHIVNGLQKFCSCRAWADVGDQLALQPKDDK